MQIETFAMLKEKRNIFISLEFEYDDMRGTQAFTLTFVISHVALCFYVSKTLHGQSPQELYLDSE